MITMVMLEIIVLAISKHQDSKHYLLTKIEQMTQVSKYGIQNKPPD